MKKRMGQTQSKQPPQPTPKKREIYKEEPWRSVRGWGKSKRDELKSEVQKLRPDTSLYVKSFNIILMGEVGSGKSSFFNSINSLFKEGIIPGKAPEGRTGRSLTKEFMMYELGKGIPIRIGDTMGVKFDTSEVDIRNILSVVDGHVPNGHEFTLHEEFTRGNPRYIAKPTIADKGHCVAIVINANDCYNMADNMKKKLQSLAEGLCSRKVPLFVLLTHLDEYHRDIQNNVTKIYHNVPLEHLVNRVTTQVHLPTKRIFPVINYQGAVELDDN